MEFIEHARQNGFANVGDRAHITNERKSMPTPVGLPMTMACGTTKVRMSKKVPKNLPACSSCFMVHYLMLETAINEMVELLHAMDDVSNLPENTKVIEREVQMYERRKQSNIVKYGQGF